MISFPLEQPNIPEIRVKLIQEKLKQIISTEATSIRIIATGRTYSGKSTLGNILVGEECLTSNGRLDCTDKVAILRFSSGLEYIDLPGIASDEEYENVNRVALQLDQIVDEQHINSVPIVLYKTGETPNVRSIPLSEINYDELKADLIFYLIAPQNQISQSEFRYMSSLLKKYGLNKVLFVFNHFVHKEQLEIQFATYQNVEDAKIKIAQVIQNSKIGREPHIVEVNCLTGENISELISTAELLLTKKKARLFSEVITYQREKAPLLFMKEFKSQFNELVIFLAEQSPKSDKVGDSDLFVIFKQITDFLKTKRNSEALVNLADDKQVHKSLRHLCKEVVEACTSQIYEPIIKTKQYPIYENRPIYSEIEETDYDSPIYSTRQIKYWRDPQDPFEALEALGNAIDGNGLKVWRERTERYVSGYRKIKRQVIVGYEQKITGYYNSDEVVGQRAVGKTYKKYGKFGIAYGFACLNFIVSEEWGSKLIKYYNQPLPILNQTPSGRKELRLFLSKKDRELYGLSFEERICRFVGI